MLSYYTIRQICKENKSFAEGLAIGICNFLPSLLEIQEEIFSQVMNKSYFGIYLISQMEKRFIDLDKEYQKKGLQISETDDALMRIFGFGLGLRLRDLQLNKSLQIKGLDPEVRKKIDMLTENDNNFKTGINEGFSYKGNM